MDYVALDFEDDAGVVNSIGGHGDGFGESTDVVGVVADLDFAGFAGHHGLLSPGRGGAAAAGADIGEDQWFIAFVGEGEDAVTVTAFIDGAVVVFEVFEDDFGTILRSVLRLILSVLSVSEAHGKHCKKA